MLEAGPRGCLTCLLKAAPHHEHVPFSPGYISSPDCEPKKSPGWKANAEFWKNNTEQGHAQLKGEEHG